VVVETMTTPDWAAAGPAGTTSRATSSSQTPTLDRAVMTGLRELNMLARAYRPGSAHVNAMLPGA